MTHLVETLRWDLRYASARAALEDGALQDRLARFLKSEGLRRIAARFDRHGGDGRVWRIDRLVLDLGRLSRHEDELQWAARLDAALELALARAGRPSDSSGPQATSARLHAVDQFLFYLSNGHLHWGVSLAGRDAVANWLERLARAHGARLWTALRAHPERERMLARLARISPHHGLHALLAQRDAPLADALQEIDDACLAPLQARGLLGTYQREQLQQALRGAGLRASWDARGSVLGAGRRPELLQRLRHVLARHLGQAWALRLSTTRNHATAAAGPLLRELLGEPAEPSSLARGEVALDADQPTRTWEAALRQLREALAGPRRHGASHGARIAGLLHRLAAAHPAALRSRLLHWAGERRQRRQWSQSLSADNLGALLAAMAPAGPSGTGQPGPDVSQWSDSLRQTALRLQREAPADRRPGLGRLQALLMEACLQRLAEGRRLPDSHSAWQALWRQAWAQWLGEADGDGTSADAAARAAAAPARTPRPPRPDDAARDRMPPPSADATRPALDQALRSLEHQSREGRWDWPQRLRLARLLETDGACARWLQLFDESRRWRMLRAQFGAAARRLQSRAQRLQQWLSGVLPEPAARAREHWRRLMRHLFVQGLSPDSASLRSHYQAQVSQEAAAPRSLAPTHEPIWVDDAGQVLLAVYAERLFKQLGLVQQGCFVDDAAQAAAVQCLQALCHGTAPRDDAGAALSRLLCGAGPGDLLAAAPPLPPDRALLLEQLLQAVVAHWKALGNTSVAGLRESFLQREGRLQRDRTAAGEPPRWRLRVHARGFDVLLDRLPWSFQTIRLPWMQGVLHVEWR